MPIRVSLREKFHSINLLQNDFKHNKYKNEDCHFPIFHHPASITTKLISQSQRLPYTGDYETSRWCTIEFPVKTFLICIRSLSSCYVLTCGGGREGGRGRIRKKKRERLISSWGTTMKNPCQLVYLPKTLLPNIITLAVKGGHNSIHSNYADLFLNQGIPSFNSLFSSLFIFPEVFNGQDEYFTKFA